MVTGASRIFRYFAALTISSAAAFYFGYCFGSANKPHKQKSTSIIASKDLPAEAMKSVRSDSFNIEKNELKEGGADSEMILVPKALMGNFYFNPFNLDYELDDNLATWLKLTSQEKAGLQDALTKLRNELAESEEKRAKEIARDDTSATIVIPADPNAAIDRRTVFEDEISRILGDQTASQFLAMSTHALESITGDFGMKAKIYKIQSRDSSEKSLVSGSYTLDMIIFDPEKTASILTSSTAFDDAASVATARIADVFEDLPQRYQHIFNAN